MTNAQGGATLYTPDILALAVELADYPMHPGLPFQGEAHSRVCGSKVALGVEVDGAGRIAALGARVSACAIGQAAAALFIRSAQGRDAAELATAIAGPEAWLGGESAMPAWPEIATLETARSYPARHAAILLPWRAALTALSNRPHAD